MTPEEWTAFVDSDLSFEEYLKKRVQDALAELPMARVEDTDIAAAERRIAELEFEKLVDQNARLGGVIPTAVPLIVPDVAKLFEMRDNALRPRNGQTMPGDPLSSLTFEAWLQEYKKTMGFLFTK
jgi:hypothetical protein